MKAALVSEVFECLNPGPSPFFTCKLCGATEPGVKEYIVAHMATHGLEPVLVQPDEQP